MFLVDLYFGGAIPGGAQGSPLDLPKDHFWQDLGDCLVCQEWNLDQLYARQRPYPLLVSNNSIVGRAFALHDINQGSIPGIPCNLQRKPKNNSWVKSQELLLSITMCLPKTYTLYYLSDPLGWSLNAKFSAQNLSMHIFLFIILASGKSTQNSESLLIIKLGS